MPVKIQISYLHHRYTSHDDGFSWDAVKRPYPSDVRPLLSKDATLSDIPFDAPHSSWNFIHIDLQNGFGLAVSTRSLFTPDRKSELEKRRTVGYDGPFTAADLYVSSDRGEAWEKCNLKLTGLAKIWAALSFSWPVEQFEGFLVTEDNEVFLSWEDPWIMENSKSHLIYSRDRCRSWAYKYIGDLSPELEMVGQNRLMCTSEKFIKSCHTSNMRWRKIAYSIDWHRFHEKGRRWAPFIRIVFLDKRVGYAFTLTWVTNSSPNSRIAVLKTRNGGKNWVALNILKISQTPSDHEKGHPTPITQKQAPYGLEVELF